MLWYKKVGLFGTDLKSVVLMNLTRGCILTTKFWASTIKNFSRNAKHIEVDQYLTEMVSVKTNN